MQRQSLNKLCTWGSEPPWIHMGFRVTIHHKLFSRWSYSWSISEDLYSFGMLLANTFAHENFPFSSWLRNSRSNLAPAGVYPWISYPNSLSLSSHYLQVVPTNTSTVLFGPQKASVKIILVTWSSTAKRAARSAKVFGSLNWSVFNLICICWRGS